MMSSGLYQIDPKTQEFLRQPNTREIEILTQIDEISKANHRKLNQQTNTQRDGGDYLYHLLATKNDILIKLGLWLLETPLRGYPGMQEILIQICQDPRFSSELRESAQGSIFPERLREISIAREQ